MSKEEDTLRDRLKGTELPETSYPEPVPVPKSDADSSYKMPGDEPVIEEPEIEVHKRTKKADDKAAQADYFKRINGESKTYEPDTEPVIDSTEQEIPLPPTPIDNGDSDERMLAMEEKINAMIGQITSIKKSNDEKDEEISILIQANSDLFLIDMQTLSEDLNDFKNTLLSIGTDRQDEEIEQMLKNKGPDMAFKKSEAFRLDDKTMARKGIHIVTAIELTINKFNEKLKYTVEA